MANTLIKRIEKLEQMHGDDDDLPKVIIITWQPRDSEELVRLTAGDWICDRRGDETEAEFRERATNELVGTGKPPFVAFGDFGQRKGNINGILLTDDR